MQKSEAYQLILKPVLTEKSTWEQENRNSYRFEVAGGANRIEVAQAIEMLFEVKVESVNTMIRSGKTRRRGANVFAESPRKIAIVTLAEGDRIELL
jgi:large subunit ribosomal protein L23